MNFLSIVLGKNKTAFATISDRSYLSTIMPKIRPNNAHNKRSPYERDQKPTRKAKNIELKTNAVEATNHFDITANITEKEIAELLLSQDPEVIYESPTDDRRSKDRRYYVRAKHANRGQMDDDVLIDFNGGRRNTPANVFGEYYGYVVRKVLFHSFNRYHSTTMKNLPVQLDLHSTMDEGQIADLESVNGYYQVFLGSVPYKKRLFK